MKQEAQQFVEVWEKAYMAGDRQALEDLYEEGAVMASHAAGLFQGRDEVIGFLNTLTTHYDIEIEDVVDSVRDEGGTVIVMCRSYATATPKTGGEAVREGARSFLILKRAQDGRLRIMYDISQLAPDVAADDTR